MLGVVVVVVWLHYLWYLVSHALLMNGVNQMLSSVISTNC